jgi:hypothetical protein
MPDHLIDAGVVDDGNLKEIIGALKTLNMRCRLMVDTGGLTLENAGQFSESIAQVRVLLMCLEQNLSKYVEAINALKDVPDQLEIAKNSCENILLSIRDLKEQYWELDGILKEARNDLQKNSL